MLTTIGIISAACTPVFTITSTSYSPGSWSTCSSCTQSRTVGVIDTYTDLVCGTGSYQVSSSYTESQSCDSGSILQLVECEGCGGGKVRNKFTYYNPCTAVTSITYGACLVDGCAET
jgi:hypothetical protein